MRTAVVLSGLLISIFGVTLPGLAQDMTEAECRKKFLEIPDKDWRGYDMCRRAATQLRVKGGEPAALPLPNGASGTPNTPSSPAAGGN